MPSDRPPEEQTRVKRFDPVVLDRTVIALPLLRDMEQDLQLIAEVRQAYPDEARANNAAVEFNPAYSPGGAAGARERVLEMATIAGQEAIATSSRRPRSSVEEVQEIQRKRHDALEQAINQQVIGPLQPGKTFSFARLHASVIRRLLAANERLISPDNPNTRPIMRLLPRRFEVILDLNLEFPGGREAARKWVLGRIEDAKKEAEVDDAGQEVHLEKDQRNSQYLFARLEARAIQKLVELDMADAKTKASELRARTDHPSEKARIEPSKVRAIFHIWPDF